MSLLPLLASMQKLLTSYVPRKDAAAASQTASQASTKVNWEESLASTSLAYSPKSV